MTIKFGYASDLHLEFLDYPNFSDDPGGDVLLLAGDILTAWAIASHRTDQQVRKLTKFLTQKFKPDLLDKYKKVFMVMGNHEHYNSIFGNTKNNLEDSFNNLGLPITILDNDVLDLNGVHLIGATLWSDFENGSPVSMYDCQRGMNDFRLIGSMDIKDMNYFNRYQSRIFTPENAYNEHIKSKQYIKLQLERLKDEKVVIMTHHGPTLKSLHPSHVGNGLDGAYASDLSEIILDNPSIKVWVSGHTHNPLNDCVGSCRLLSNPLGYRGEYSYRQWTGIKHFEV